MYLLRRNVVSVGKVTISRALRNPGTAFLCFSLALAARAAPAQEAANPQEPLARLIETAQGLPLTFRTDLELRAVEMGATKTPIKRGIVEVVFQHALQLPQSAPMEAIESGSESLAGQLALLGNLRLDGLSVRLRAVEWLMSLDGAAAGDLFETIQVEGITGDCKRGLAPDLGAYYRTLARVLETLPPSRGEALLMRHVAAASSACQVVPLAHFLANAPRDFLPAVAALPGAMNRAGDPSCFALLRKDERLEKAEKALTARLQEDGLNSHEIAPAFAALRRRVADAISCNTPLEPMPARPEGLVSRLVQLRAENPETTPPWVEEYVASSLSKIELWNPKDSCGLCTFFAKTELFLALLGLVPGEMQSKVAERYLRFLEGAPEWRNHPSAWLSRFQPVLRLMRTPDEQERQKLDDLRTRGYVLNFLPSSDAAGLSEMFARSANPVVAAYLEAERILPAPFQAPAAPK